MAQQKNSLLQGKREQLCLASSVAVRRSKCFSENDLNSFQHLPWRSTLQTGLGSGASVLQRALVPGYGEGSTPYNIFLLPSVFYRISSMLLARMVRNSDHRSHLREQVLTQMSGNDCLKLCWRRCREEIEDLWFLCQIQQCPLIMRAPGRNQILVCAFGE